MNIAQKVETIKVLNRKKYRFDIKRMMADCEANYARLCQLLRGKELSERASVAYSIGGAGARGQSAISAASVGAQPASETEQRATNFNLTVTEQHRFSTCVQLDIDQPCLELDINGLGVIQFTVMIYHDVRMVEVINCNRRRANLASYPFINDVMFLPDEKAQQNRFLGEWLGLCLAQGLSEPVSFEFARQTLSAGEPLLAGL